MQLFKAESFLHYNSSNQGHSSYAFCINALGYYNTCSHTNVEHVCTALTTFYQLRSWLFSYCMGISYALHILVFAKKFVPLLRPQIIFGLSYIMESHKYNNCIHPPPFCQKFLQKYVYLTNKCPSSLAIKFSY